MELKEGVWNHKEKEVICHSHWFGGCDIKTVELTRRILKPLQFVKWRKMSQPSAVEVYKALRCAERQNIEHKRSYVESGQRPIQSHTLCYTVAKTQGPSGNLCYIKDIGYYFEWVYPQKARSY